MSRKLPKPSLEEIASILPAKERLELASTDLTPEWLEKKISLSQHAMKLDLWVGIPWFAIYTVALFSQGIGIISIGIFVAGMIYFIYAVFSRGSYGLNKKRLKVYQQLLDKMKI